MVPVDDYEKTYMEVFVITKIRMIKDEPFLLGAEGGRGVFLVLYGTKNVILNLLFFFPMCKAQLP